MRISTFSFKNKSKKISNIQKRIIWKRKRRKMFAKKLIFFLVFKLRHQTTNFDVLLLPKMCVIWQRSFCVSLKLKQSCWIDLSLNITTLRCPDVSIFMIIYIFCDMISLISDVMKLLCKLAVRRQRGKYVEQQLGMETGHS